MLDDLPTIKDMIEQYKYSGCFLGLALGDAYGAPFEGGVLARLLWRCMAKTRHGCHRYTDDTQMSIDLAESYLAQNTLDQQHLANSFAANYRWSRGYGPAAAWLLKQIKAGAAWQTVNRVKFKDGSLGNGAAMRAPILALCAPDDALTLQHLVAQASEITHAHPLAIDGAQIIALATQGSLHSQSSRAILTALLALPVHASYQDKLTCCADYVFSDSPLQRQSVKAKLGNGMVALDSCVTAVCYALKYKNTDFDEMHANICRLGGDVDTIAAMAGAIWGAANGVRALHRDKIVQLENSELIFNLAKQLHGHVYASSTHPNPN